MAVPSRRELLEWAAQYVALWNAHDKEAWVANWKKVAPGDFRMHDPVGTPLKQGFQECASDAWDLFNERVHFTIREDSLFVCANEVAWLLENRITTDGETALATSIETYRFEEDGSVTIRTWYRVPERDESELGEMFQTYLPEEG